MGWRSWCWGVINGEVCSTEGFACYYPPACSGAECRCVAGSDGALRWNCAWELCRL